MIDKGARDANRIGAARISLLATLSGAGVRGGRFLAIREVRNADTNTVALAIRSRFTVATEMWSGNATLTLAARATFENGG
jgi:hypothetical protein